MNDLNERTRGKVFAYTEAANTGVIVTQDGHRYLFSKKDWQSEQFPVIDLNVLFIVEFNWAKSITIEQ